MIGKLGKHILVDYRLARLSGLLVYRTWLRNQLAGGEEISFAPKMEIRLLEHSLLFAFGQFNRCIKLVDRGPQLGALLYEFFRLILLELYRIKLCVYRGLLSSQSLAELLVSCNPVIQLLLPKRGTLLRLIGQITTNIEPFERIVRHQPRDTALH